MYEAINKLCNYRIIYANFIYEYGINFHELYLENINLILASIIREGDNDNGPRMVRFCACVICF